MPRYQKIFSLILIVCSSISSFATLSANKLIEDDDHIYEATHYQFRLETVTDRVSTPWGIAFLPDGRFVVTEISGGLRIYGPEGEELGRRQKLSLQIDHGYRSGLMDVAAHPNFSDNNWLYFTYTKSYPRPGARSNAFTALARARLSPDNKISDLQDIWEAPNYASPNRGTSGSRIAITEQHLYFSTGDRNLLDAVQRIDTPHGKILRLNLDGSVPQDNPLVQTPQAIPSIWSVGHRNPQGLAIQPGTGQLFATEHGPRGGDELNVILPARNYGWPTVSYGVEYDGTSITNASEGEGFVSPITHWTPSIAPCGIDFYQGKDFPKWEGDLLVTALAAEELRRVEIIKGARVIHQEVLLKWQGRVRDVKVSPKGEVYLLFNSPDRIAKMVPVRDNQAFYDQRARNFKNNPRRTSMDTAAEEKIRTLSDKRTKSRQDPALALIQSHCTSCHGRGFAGGSAPALVPGQLNHVKTPEDFARILRDGIPEKGMPALANLFTETELKTLTDYLERVFLKQRTTNP